MTQHVGFLIVFLPLLCASGRVSGQPSPLGLAETLLVRQEYAEAKALVTRHLAAFPDDNRALYIRYALEQTELLDYESYPIKNESFQRLSDSTRAVLEERLPRLRGTDSVECLFYLANVYGGKAVLLAKTGNWLAALKDALASVTLLKEVVRLDSTNLAAHLGIGVFHYYLSKSFSWLPFIDANSEHEGIKAIEKATAAPWPYCFAAKNSLSWIVVEKKDLRRADSIAAGVLNEMPRNTIFLRLRCLVLLWSGRFDSTIVYAERLARISEKRDPVNWSDLVLAYYAIAEAHDGLGRGKEAMAAIDYICGKKIPRDYKNLPPVKKNFKKISAIQRKYQPSALKQKQTADAP